MNNVVVVNSHEGIFLYLFTVLFTVVPWSTKNRPYLIVWHALPSSGAPFSAITANGRANVNYPRGAK